MNIPIQKIIGIALSLFFLSGCAVFIGDGDYHHRGYWRRHSSLQQSNLLADHQMTALNGGEAQDHHQVRR